MKVALRWNICMSRNSYPLYIKKRICEFQKMLAVIKVNVLVDLHHLNFSFSIFLMLCIHMVYIHPSSLLLQSKEEKRPNLPFCWMFRIFRPLYLSVCVHVFFGWLFTKITYSTLVPFHHILDITYHVILHSNACCSIHLPLSHMWKPFIYTYKTAFCPALLIFFFFIRLHPLLACSSFIHFVIFSAQYKRQPTDCYQNIAHTKHVRIGSISFSGKWKKKKKTRAKSQFKQRKKNGKHNTNMKTKTNDIKLENIKTAQNAIWNKIAMVYMEFIYICMIFCSPTRCSERLILNTENELFSNTTEIYYIYL